MEYWSAAENQLSLKTNNLIFKFHCTSKFETKNLKPEIFYTRHTSLLIRGNTIGLRYENHGLINLWWSIAKFMCSFKFNVLEGNKNYLHSEIYSMKFIMRKCNLPWKSVFLQRFGWLQEFFLYVCWPHPSLAMALHLILSNHEEWVVGVKQMIMLLY